jgi:hypothetical protein
MKRSRFKEEQIIAILREQEAGSPPTLPPRSASTIFFVLPMAPTLRCSAIWWITGIFRRAVLTDASGNMTRLLLRFGSSSRRI